MSCSRGLARQHTLLVGFGAGIGDTARYTGDPVLARTDALYLDTAVGGKL